MYGHGDGDVARERTRPARTLLEQLIWQWRLTLEEFSEYAERFAREQGEPGTLSVRHLKRLVAGSGADGRPLGRPRQVTARLLERIFDVDIEQLLSAPEAVGSEDDGARELRERLRASSRIDRPILALLQDQLAGIRRLDRQMGARVAHDDVLTKTSQVTQFLSYSLTPANRQELAALLAELSALAGWQALDTGQLTTAWKHYEHSKAAATECDDPSFLVRTEAEQAFVLLDLGETSAAVDILGATCKRAEGRATALMRSWVAAACGEALAAAGRRFECLQAFDEAYRLLPSGRQDQPERPYVALDSAHLARWQGHALASIGEPAAIEVLRAALRELDATFARAEASLQVDLAIALTAGQDREAACVHLARAETLATGIGSARQHRRLRTVQQRL